MKKGYHNKAFSQAIKRRLKLGGIIFCLIIFVSLLASKVNSGRVSATVISIVDGDTIAVRHAGENVTVRLACIDAPENGQQGREASVKQMEALLANGDDVTLRLITEDRYGRQVAEVYRQDVLINLKMVAEGQAVVYEKYLDPCDGTIYRSAQNAAQTAKLGIWSGENPIMPWHYRRGERPQVSQPTQMSENLPSCVNDDCDCSHFTTQAQAQRVLEAVAGDPHRLDGDRDGVACESLP